MCLNERFEIRRRHRMEEQVFTPLEFIKALMNTLKLLRSLRMGIIAITDPKSLCRLNNRHVRNLKMTHSIQIELSRTRTMSLIKPPEMLSKLHGQRLVVWNILLDIIFLTKIESRINPLRTRSKKQVLSILKTCLKKQTRTIVKLITT